MKPFVSILALVLLSGCTGEAESTRQIGDYTIERLFEQDGCRMYRFRDNGRHYFMTCGPVAAVVEQNHCWTTGKVTSCDKEVIQSSPTE